MSRIKIDLPSRFVFSTQIPIRIDDINYGSHLGHDSVLTLAHEARVRFLTAHGYTEDNIEGVGIIMGDVGITYSSEAFYGDLQGEWNLVCIGYNLKKMYALRG